MQYPPTKRDTVVDIYHTISVEDPYRWLEDPNAQETQVWSEAQNALTRSFLDSFPKRDFVKQRLTTLMNYPRYGVPQRKGKHYFYTHLAGLQNQPVLKRCTALDGPATVVLDPNRFSSDGTVALENIFFHKDGSLLAYSTSQNGSDWQEIRILQPESGQEYKETLRWCRAPALTWKDDGSGFYYNRYPDPTGLPSDEQSTNMKVYWHRLGTPQSDDILVYERPDAKELHFAPLLTDDQRYLTLHVTHGTDIRSRFYYRDETTGGDFIRLLDDNDAPYTFLGNDGPLFYFLTGYNAPRNRIIAIDITQPEREHWRELVPEQEATLTNALMVNDQFVLCYTRDAHNSLSLYRHDGTFEREIALPMPGTVLDIAGTRAQSELFFGFTSFLAAPTIYRYDFATHTLALVFPDESGFQAEPYETRQIFYTSKDGTRVPMFLTHKKGLVLDGQNPVLLYGYGGFAINMMPSYSPLVVAWLESGGVYALANIRGGFEYGDEWHRAGMLDRKQNVFDDFIAAAEWLIEQHYTNPKRLAIYGGSNGGLLVSACMTQRPELYGAVLASVPVTDMLRFHKFTVGRYWIPEYGNPEASEQEFKTLYAYSPLHNVREQTVYPPTLLLTADTDDRVVPAHAKKFAAALQTANAGEAPILLRIEPKAGHGHGKPLSKQIEELSDLLIFLYKTFEIDPEPQKTD